MNQARARQSGAVVEGLLVMLIALGVRLVHLDHTPHYDEFFHVLAARSWLDRGTFCIANCIDPYRRGLLYTLLVAASFRLFGPGLVTARLPSLLAGVLWAGAVFFWTRRVGGRTAGWAAGLLVALDPGAIYLSQIARFYSLHALLFWIGATGLFLAFESAHPRRTVVLSGLALLVALHLQVTTAMGLLGVAAWLGCALIRRFGGPRRWRPGWRWAAVGSAVSVLAAGLWLVRSGVAGLLWEGYRWSTLWTAKEAADPKFLYDWFLAQYQWLWTLLPAAAVVAVTRYPRPASFSLTVFGSAFLIHSFAGDKSFRVVYYFIPFFLALWALALAVLIPLLWRELAALTGRLPGRLVSATQGNRLAAIGMAAILGFVSFSTDSLNTTFKMMTLTDAAWPGNKPRYRGNADWRPAAAALRAIADSVDVVMASSVHPAIFYIGRADAAISANQLYLGRGQMAPEFAVDPRAGVPIVSRPESVDLIIGCYATGLIVVDKTQWRVPAAVSPAVADVITARTTPVPLPPKADQYAFRWRQTTPAQRADCVPPPLSRRDAIAP